MTDAASGSGNSAAAFGADELHDHAVYRRLTTPEIAAALASRERYEVRDALERAEAKARSEGRLRPPAAVPDISNEELRRHLSDRAYDLIVDFETGGRELYESPHGYNKRPCWPGGQSGVTIGCGYDLGYNTARDFEAAWGGRLPYQDLTILAGALGLKGQAARRYMPRVSHIIIEWGVALAVFDAVDLPEESRRTYRHLPKSIALHPHCFGALVSLVFNRGASFELQGDRYREMRAIKRMVDAGDVRGVPGQIRAMKRLWIGQGVDGLLIRRDKEADLFQAGLNAMRVASQPEETRRRLAIPPAVAGASRTVTTAGGEPDSDLTWLQTLTDDELDEVLYGGQSDDGKVREAAPMGTMARRYDVSDVAWVRNDANHPDYVHLPPDAKGRNFRLSGGDLEMLVRFNRFAPHIGAHNKLIFALRGCALARDADHQEDSDELQLVDVRPNHFDFKCVIGIYDSASHKLSAYKASTVCNAGAVVSCYNYYAYPHQEKKGNILLTGCYRMSVGTHYRLSGATIPGVFRLGTGAGPDTATKHTVLRTGNDVTFGTQDIFDPCTPQDNLHPAMHSGPGFSSLGCMTVKGIYGQDHEGEWKRFRAAAGLRHSQDQMGTRYDMVLLTGLDAATLDNLRQAGEEVLSDTLSCLRQGSQGPEVSKLQTALGMANPTGVFDWSTAEKLSDHQMNKLGWASGTYGRNMDVLLGFEILGPALVG